jgi:hypothetical protein
MGLSRDCRTSGDLLCTEPSTGSGTAIIYRLQRVRLLAN